MIEKCEYFSWILRKFMLQLFRTENSKLTIFEWNHNHFNFIVSVEIIESITIVNVLWSRKMENWLERVDRNTCHISQHIFVLGYLKYISIKKKWWKYILEWSRIPELQNFCQWFSVGRCGFGWWFVTGLHEEPFDLEFPAFFNLLFLLWFFFRFLDRLKSFFRGSRETSVKLTVREY